MCHIHVLKTLPCIIIMIIVITIMIIIMRPFTCLPARVHDIIARLLATLGYQQARLAVSDPATRGRSRRCTA